MAKLHEKPTKHYSKSSFFLGCFGCDDGDTQKMLLKQEMVKTTGSRRKKGSGWFKLWSFRKKSATAKTVPFDTSLVTKMEFMKSDHKVVAGDIQLEIEAVEPAPVVLKKKRHKESRQNTTFDNRKVFEFQKSKNGDKNQKESKSRRKKDQRAVDAKNNIINLDNSVIHMSSSKSFQVPSSEKSTGRVTRSASLNDSKSRKSEMPIGREKKSCPLFSIEEPKSKNSARQKGKEMIKSYPKNSLRGMSIIGVTLVVLILWGKLYAILCTSMWFFLVARLETVQPSSDATKNTASNSNREAPNDVVPKELNLKPDVSDLNSEEHKKKVVLEGLLRRSRRSVSGFL